ncbi:MAG: DUF6766 family protein [Steroidobacteraceae bacterium]
MRGFLRNNGLSIVVFALFLAFLLAQALTGARQYNEERQEHGEAPLGLPAYLASGHFIEATAENWESEFLQMAAYVLLTVGLYQRGSSESKRPGIREAVDQDPRTVSGLAAKEAPWPVRRGGWVLRLYENSLSLAFLLLFGVSFALHAVGGARLHNAEQLRHGGETVTAMDFLGSSQFWFESFQNWQSEFLSIVGMVVLSIWLRQRGSPESKPVHAPHDETGSH